MMVWKNGEASNPVLSTLYGLGIVDRSNMVSDGGNPFLFMFKLIAQINDADGSLDLVMGFDEEAGAMLVVMMEDVAKREGFFDAYQAKVDQMRKELETRIKEKGKD